jgi:hypothetical protein
MKYYLSLLFAATLLWGCQPEAPIVAAPSSDAISPADSTMLPIEGIGIGDVEYGMTFSVTVDEAAAGAAVTVENMEKLGNKITMSTATVSPPRPKELFVYVAMKGDESYAERPVAIRGKLFRDKEIIETFATVLGKNADGRVAPDPRFPMVFHYDILKDVPSTTETFLVVAEAEILLMPAGTDESTLDPLTASVMGSDKTVIMSNPLRINFTGE